MQGADFRYAQVAPIGSAGLRIADWRLRIGGSPFARFSAASVAFIQPRQGLLHGADWLRADDRDNAQDERPLDRIADEAHAAVGEDDRCRLAADEFCL
jgi:hypothetical protein